MLYTFILLALPCGIENAFHKILQICTYANKRHSSFCHFQMEVLCSAFPYSLYNDHRQFKYCTAMLIKLYFKPKNILK